MYNNCFLIPDGCSRPRHANPNEIQLQYTTTRLKLPVILVLPYPLHTQARQQFFLRSWLDGERIAENVARTRRARGEGRRSQFLVEMISQVRNGRWVQAWLNEHFSRMRRKLVVQIPRSKRYGAMSGGRHRRLQRSEIAEHISTFVSMRKRSNSTSLTPRRLALSVAVSKGCVISVSSAKRAKLVYRTDPLKGGRWGSSMTTTSSHPSHPPSINASVSHRDRSPTSTVRERECPLSV